MLHLLSEFNKIVKIVKQYTQRTVAVHAFTSYCAVATQHIVNALSLS